MYRHADSHRSSLQPLRTLAGALAAVAYAIAAGNIAAAAPGDVLFYDNLNGNLNDWTVSASGGDAGIGNETSQQGRALRLRWGAVSVTSDPFDAAVPAARLELWIRRGADSFSEDPDAGEDLLVEYLSDSGSWNALLFYGGDDDSPGEVYTPGVVLPADALHSALRLRFRQTGGDGEDWDYWHVDDPSVTEIAAAAEFGPGQCSGFEAGLGDWSVAASGGSAGVSAATAATGTSSLFTRWGPVTVTSRSIDLSGAGSLDVSVWIRRGDDGFSEDPDSGEDLAVEYLDAGGNWITLETFAGNGTPGEISTPGYALPAAARHANFRLRFRQTGGDGADWDYWHIDDVCMTGGEQALYRFEETTWTGAAGEVTDSGPLGVDGATSGGLQGSQTTPALAGNPGTCRYADFDGVDDYVEVPDHPALDLPDALTIGVWINARSIPPSGLHTIVSKDWNYEFHVDSSGRIYWWWNNEAGAVRTLTSSSPVSPNRWHHVAIAYESGSQVLYLDGNPVATSAHAEALRLNDLPFYIGTDYNFLSRAFDGFIDEVTVYARALSQADVQTLMLETHPCASVTPQFAVNHDGYAINCLEEAITVDVVDAASGTPLTDYNATVVLDSQTGRGSWRLVAGGGSLSDAAADDGLAVYDWPLGESQAIFGLFYPQGSSPVDVDFYQQNNAGIRDNDAEGVLVFSPSGFTLTATAVPNPVTGTIVPFQAPQTAGTDFAIHIAAYGQTPGDAQCGVIESYAGTRNLEIWMDHQDPGTGSRLVSIDGTAAGAQEPQATGVAVEFSAGQASVTARYKDAGRVRVSLKDSTPADPDLAAGIRGATAGFVVKPHDFVLTGISDGSGTPNPAAVDHSGTVFVAAGESFTATVTARDAEGDPTPNYGRESIPESVALAPALIAPAGGSVPPVDAATGFANFTAGSATATDLNWPEVGIITLTPGVGDGDYLGAGDVSGVQTGPVGRFVPDHFETSVNLPLFATACAAGNYTYLGEPFHYALAPVVTVTAKALGGRTTENYRGDFFKLTTAGLPGPGYTASTGVLDTGLLPGAAADPVVDPLPGGQGTLTFSSGGGLAFQRAAPAAAFDAEIRLSQQVVDADGVTAAVNPVVFGAIGGIGFDQGASMRYGRLRVSNAYGSERIDLAVPLVSEVFVDASTGFVAHADDSCTTAVNVAFTGYSGNIGTGDTCVLDTGTPGASGSGCAAEALPGRQFRAPPVAGDFNLFLSAPGDGNDGRVELTVDAPSWLQYDWDAGAAGTEDPQGTAVFGIYEGTSRLIYIREITR